MLINYIKIALRNIFKHKSYSFINILGLAIGTACSILIGIFVIHELSYDKFHENADQMYRVWLKGRMGDNEIEGPTSCPPMAFIVVDEFPEVLQATRIQGKMSRLVNYEENRFNEDGIILADSTFFDVFTFPLIRGNPKTALAAPFKIVISEEMAEKYFGDDDPMGKSLRFDDDTTWVEITGIMKNVPSNSHFHFDFVGSLSSLEDSRNPFWLSNNYQTYFVLQEGADYKELNEKFIPLLEKYAGPQLEQITGASFEEFLERGNELGYYLQALKEIHLHSDSAYDFEANGDILYVYIFSIVSIFILLIACINFMNLATARSASRSKEVGLRKVIGAGKGLLIRQFIGESIFLSFISLILAIIIVILLLPAFNNITGKELTLSYFNPYIIIPVLIGLGIFVGFISGIYPAFILASFKPIAILKGKFTSGSKSSLLRRILVIFQFTISVIIIIGTFVIFSQMKFVKNKDLNFDKKNVLIVQNARVLRTDKEEFQNDIQQYSGVISTSHTTSLPATGFSENGHFLEGRDMSDVFLLSVCWSDPDIFSTLGLSLSDGRFFSRDITSDSSAIVINEAAVKYLGLEDPIGKRLIGPGETPEQGEYKTIVGVVKDYHFASLHVNIRPQMFEFIRENFGGYIAVKIQGDNIAETRDYIESKWNEYVHDHPFEYTYLEDDFNNLHDADFRTMKIFISFSVLAVIIACLGLFGLVSYTATQRTKEIGIRKVLGANVQKILVLLSREMVFLILIGFVIASVPAFFWAKGWLQNFEYTSGQNPWIYIITLLLILLIALITVSFQTIRASMANPAESLRYE